LGGMLKVRHRNGASPLGDVYVCFTFIAMIFKELGVIRFQSSALFEQHKFCLTSVQRNDPFVE
jgi:hypothetical protein